MEETREALLDESVILAQVHTYTRTRTRTRTCTRTHARARTHTHTQSRLRKHTITIMGMHTRQDALIHAMSGSSPPRQGHTSSLVLPPFGDGHLTISGERNDGGAPARVVQGGSAVDRANSQARTQGEPSQRSPSGIGDEGRMDPSDADSLAHRRQVSKMQRLLHQIEHVKRRKNHQRYLPLAQRAELIYLSACKCLRENSSFGERERGREILLGTMRGWVSDPCMSMQ